MAVFTRPRLTRSTTTSSNGMTVRSATEWSYVNCWAPPGKNGPYTKAQSLSYAVEGGGAARFRPLGGLRWFGKHRSDTTGLACDRLDCAAIEVCVLADHAGHAGDHLASDRPGGVQTGAVPFAAMTRCGTDSRHRRFDSNMQSLRRSHLVYLCRTVLCATTLPTLPQCPHPNP